MIEADSGVPALKLAEKETAQANKNQTHAAKLLDISRDALRYKLKKFGLIRGDREEENARMSRAEE